MDQNFSQANANANDSNCNINHQSDGDKLSLENKNLRQELETKRLQLIAIQENYLELQKAKKALDEQFQIVSKDLYMIEHSLFWRIMKPARGVFKKLKLLLSHNLITRKVYRALVILKNLGPKGLITAIKSRRKGKRSATKPARKELNFQREYKFEISPKVSILVPLYNTPKNFLVEMIDSVVSQTYPNWELCLADGSDNAHSDVGCVCKFYSQKDSRIIYKKLEKNLGISENTNACINMSTGDYIALFDHDDILHISALFEMIKAVNEQGADFVYTDEMTFEGKLKNCVTLHFKPDFALENLRANNYICHFSMFKRALLDKAGMFNPEFDGSQDHDMILRLTEQAEKIVHIPKILYFWRSHPGSVASDINSKVYAIDAAKKAVIAHLKRCGLSAKVESTKAFPTIFRIKYALISNPLVSIIIPNKDSYDILKRCIDSILNKSTYSNYEIIIVENNSQTKSIFSYYESLKSNKRIKTITYTGDFNYSLINNYAVTYANGEQLIFLNNDIEVITPEWIEELLMYSQRRDVGAVGAKLFFPNDTIQHAGIIVGIGKDGVAGHSHYKVPNENLGYMGKLYYARNVSAVTAACMMVKKALFYQVNGFDSDFKVSYNDVDFCLSIMKNGYYNIFTPYCEMYHYESASRGYENTPKKSIRFAEEVERFKIKWKDFLEKGDPYYNKNFNGENQNF